MIAATGNRLVFVAGQVAEDAQGREWRRWPIPGYLIEVDAIAAVD